MTNNWILIGDKENWKIAIDNSIWGIKENFKNRWEKINTGDLLFFYSTSPVKSIIGYGKATEKLIGKKLLWKEELNKNKIIFPYRINFKIEGILKNTEGEKRINPCGVSLMAGINSIKRRGVVKEILSRLKSQL